MPVPIISNITSILGYRIGEYWEYQPQTTNIPPAPPVTSWSWTGLPPGIQADILTGKIYGAGQQPGVFLARVVATNADGTSNPLIVPIGIYPGVISPDIPVLINIDTRNMLVFPHNPPKNWRKNNPVAFVKTGDSLIMDIGFTPDAGQTFVEPVVEKFDFGVKEAEYEPLVVLSSWGAVTINYGDYSRFRVKVDFEGEELKNMLDNYEGKDTHCDVMCEIQWKQKVNLFGNSTLDSITRTTQTFRIRVGREFIQ